MHPLLKYIRLSKFNGLIATNSTTEAFIFVAVLLKKIEQ